MSYPGTKGQSGTPQLIIGQMPPHDVYVETFAGRGTICGKKLPASSNVLIDVDAGAVAWLRNAAANAKFGVTAGVEILQANGITALRAMRCFESPRTLAYVDPPYMLSTRKGRRYYNHELTDEDHATLLATLRAVTCMVMVSHPPHPLYVHQLQNWRCISYRERNRRHTMEQCLWCNFPEPTVLHDWRFAGMGYRERLTLKRLALRWKRRLDAMPARKRGFVLNHLALTSDPTLSADNAGNDVARSKTCPLSPSKPGV